MKKEKATAAVRLYPSTRKKLKIIAAKKGLTFAEAVASLLSR
jgi:hypothetical protein